MQDKSETIEIQGILAKEVYDNGNFNIGAIVKTIEGGPTYTVCGISTDFNYDSGFQGMLLQDNQTGEFVIAFRGTEPNQGLDELYNDLIIADILYMGTGRGPQQMKDAMDFVNKMKDLHGLNSTNTTFTGHSLGGALAGMASYVYGFETYTYNGYGNGQYRGAPGRVRQRHGAP